MSRTGTPEDHPQGEEEEDHRHAPHDHPQEVVEVAEVAEVVEVAEVAEVVEVAEVAEVVEEHSHCPDMHLPSRLKSF